MYRGAEKKGPTGPYKNPVRPGSTPTLISVPTPLGQGKHDRRNASRSAWDEGIGSTGGRQHHQSRQQYGHGARPPYRNGQQGASSGQSSRGGTISLVDDFDDGDGGRWNTSGPGKSTSVNLDVDGKKARALERNQLAPKPIAEESKRDNMHATDEKARQAQAAQQEINRKARQEKEAEAKKAAVDKLNLDQKRKDAAARNSASGIKSLPSFKRKNSNRPDPKGKQREQIAEAAEKRRREARGISDDIQDFDEDRDPSSVMSRIRNGTAKELASSAQSNSKKKIAVDVDALLMPNKPNGPWTGASKSSSASQPTVLEIDASPPRKKAPAPRRRTPPPPKSPSPEPVDIQAMIAQDREAEDTSSDEETSLRLARALVATQAVPKSRRSGSPDALLWGDETPVDASLLCPFCSNLLPEKPSKTLTDLLAYLLDQPNIVDFPTARNPEGKRLPVTQTATLCRLHEEERTIIPDGIAQGWPTDVDWAGLPKRIDRQLSQHLSDVITGRRSSSYLEDAKEEWQAKGSKMNNLMNQFGNFDVEQPGYYGTRGQEVILATLTKLFITDTPILTALRAAPLDPTAYMRRVLVPETAMQLIKKDLSLPDDETAQVVLRESRAFGRALWAGGLEGQEAEARFVREEEMRERVEEEEASQERPTKSAKGKEKALPTEEDPTKEKRREEKRRKQEVAARALEIKKKVSVMNGSDSDDEDQAAPPPRRKPRACGSSSPASAAPAKRKPKMQLAKERQEATAAASTSGAGASDSDELEVLVKPNKKQRSRPSPSPELAIGKSAASFSIPRSKAPPSSSSDDVLPRANGKTIARTASISKSARDAPDTSSKSSKASSVRSKSDKSSKKASAPKDGSDSDSWMEQEITTNVRKKGKVQLAPWEKSKKKAGGGKGKKRKTASDESDPPIPDSSSDSDSEMDVD